jgi:hypothetical protein
MAPGCASRQRHRSALKRATVSGRGGRDESAAGWPAVHDRRNCDAIMRRRG